LFPPIFFETEKAKKKRFTDNLTISKYVDFICDVTFLNIHIIYINIINIAYNILLQRKSVKSKDI